jgi:hypothetical protein
MAGGGGIGLRPTPAGPAAGLLHGRELWGYVWVSDRTAMPETGGVDGGPLVRPG